MSNWGRNDAPAAGEFLASLPDGASRDKAVVAFIDAADSRHPELAAQWVAQIPGDDNSRHSRIEKVAGYWLRYDEKAARQWLVQSGLPEDRQAKLLQRYQANSTRAVQSNLEANPIWFRR
jgi:hypothetical protein